jgi:hypothetical protein
MHNYNPRLRKATAVGVPDAGVVPFLSSATSAAEALRDSPNLAFGRLSTAIGAFVRQFQALL